MENSYLRSLVKTISWRVIGAAVTFFSFFIFFNQIQPALKAMFLRELIAFVLYFLHERVWNKIQFGLKRPY